MLNSWCAKITQSQFQHYRDRIVRRPGLQRTVHVNHAGSERELRAWYVENISIKLIDHVRFTLIPVQTQIWTYTKSGRVVDKADNADDS